MYKVTLSMPIYNVAPYVERALLSALNQTFESIEFLLVDDRGTDNSMEIVRRIIKDHPRGKDVRIIEHPHNIGTGATKNTAIDNAQGEYLFFMDSDDEITPDCIQILYDKMKEYPVDFVVGSYQTINWNQESQKIIFEDLVLKGNNCLSNLVYKKMFFFPITSWNKLYRMSFLRNNNIRCYPKHLNEDHIFSRWIIYYTKSCSFTSTETLIYYRRDNSTTGSIKFNTFSYRNADEHLEIAENFKLLLSYYEKTELYNFYQIWLIKCLSSFFCAYYNSHVIKLKDKMLYNRKLSEFKFDFLSMLNTSYSKKNLWYIFFLKAPFCIKAILYKMYKYYSLIK